MNNHRESVLSAIRLFLLLLLIGLAWSQSFAQGPVFTYQGRLTDGGPAANGNYDFRFRLFDAAEAGTQLGPLNALGNVPVTNGVFTVQLNFGNPLSFPDNFSGADRYLEIAVRQASQDPNAPFTTLSPRQQITASPYAIRSASASSADSTASFSGPLAGDVTGTQAATVVSVVGGQTASDIGSAVAAAKAATDVNTGNLIVRRDGNGSFSANVVNVTGGFNIGGSPVIRVSGAGSNMHVGPFAGSSVSSGTNDTFVGAGAGSADSSGSNNTFIGSGTGGLGALNNITVIGAGAIATQSNSLVLGGVNGVNGVTTDTNVGIGTTAPAARLDIGVNSTHILMGDAGCNNTFAGIGFKFLSGCTNYSLLGDGVSTMINRPSGGSIFFRENNLSQMTITTGGLIGIGTSAPKTQLHLVKDNAGALGPSLTLMNSLGGAGAGASLDFDSYDPGLNAPAARIQSIDDGSNSDSLSFQTKIPGSSTNALAERMRISSNGVVATTGQLATLGGVSIGTGVDHNGGGFKHARVSFTVPAAPVNGSIGIGVGLFWTTPFPDNNYTVVAMVEDSGTVVTMRTIIFKTASQVTVEVENSTQSSHSGVLHLIAVHD